MSNDITNVLVLYTDTPEKLVQVLNEICSFDDDGNAVGLDFSKLHPIPEELREMEHGFLMDSCISQYMSVCNKKNNKIGYANWPEFRSDLRPIYTDDEYDKLWEAICNSDNYTLFGRSVAPLHLSNELPECDLSIGAIRLGEKYVQNFQLYGAFTWYDWSRAHWGTKWNTYGMNYVSKLPVPKCAQEVMEKLPNCYLLRFWTAWSPPIPLLTELKNTFKDLSFYYWWADEDFASNVGYMHVKQENGSSCLEYKELDDCSKEAFELAEDVISDMTIQERGYVYSEEAGTYVYNDEED